MATIRELFDYFSGRRHLKNKNRPYKKYDKPKAQPQAKPKPKTGTPPRAEAPNLERPVGEAGVTMEDKYRSAVRCSVCHQFTRARGGLCAHHPATTCAHCTYRGPFGKPCPRHGKVC